VLRINDLIQRCRCSAAIPKATESLPAAGLYCTFMRLVLFD